MGLTVHQSAVFTVKAKALQCLQVLPMQGISMTLWSIRNTYLVTCVHNSKLEKRFQIAQQSRSTAGCCCKVLVLLCPGATCHQQYFCCRQYARQEVGIPAFQDRPVQRVACKML